MTRAGSAVDLAGRRALVTGGTKGIGATIAATLLHAGAEVVVCGRNEPDTLPGSDRGTARFVASDIRDPAAQSELIASTVDLLGGLDLLVNNAGGSPNTDARTASPRFTASIVALNLTAPIQLAQQAYAALAESPHGGHVINIGSVSGRLPSPGTAAYSAAKAGLTMATRALALEFAPQVRVNQITVGLVQTELAHLYYGDEAGVQAVASAIPMGRMATPEDVASAVLLLCSPLAAYVTGAELAVDGGGEVPARFLAAGLDVPRARAAEFDPPARG